MSALVAPHKATTVYGRHSGRSPILPRLGRAAGAVCRYHTGREATWARRPDGQVEAVCYVCRVDRLPGWTAPPRHGDFDDLARPARPAWKPLPWTKPAGGWGQPTWAYGGTLELEDAQMDLDRADLQSAILPR